MATGVLLVYPYGWFLYGSGYAGTRSCSPRRNIGVLLLLEDDRPLLAGLVGIVATAAFPTGIIVVVGLVSSPRRAQGHHRPRPVDHDRCAAAGGSAPSGSNGAMRPFSSGCAGVGAYVLFQWVVFHDPLRALHAERAWQQPQGWSTWPGCGC